ncbi:MAG: Gfo/Idh/MocA family protein [Thermoguttaceae bacterium]
MHQRFTRRKWLRNSAFAGIGLWVSGGTGSARAQSPNEKLNIAYIGCGGRGAGNLDSLASENVVALCDADEARAAGVFNRFPNVPKFSDFRKMLSQMDKQIDAVVVSTPNHTHAPASVMAMRMGKHCYCEKPLTHSVYEARVAAQVAAEKKVATQMGIQIHASSNYRRALELIQAGLIGPIHQCEVWTTAAEGGGERPKDTPPVPKTLHWDLWLGPAPWRPYHPCYLPRQWHFWWDFGGGVLGNVGCHFMDLPFWALQLRHPAAVEAEGPPVHPETTPRRLTVRYEFPARASLPPVTLTWYHGQHSPRVKTDHVPAWDYGFLFIGEKGMLLVDYSRRVLLPEERFAGLEPPKPTIPDSIGHWREWVVACKTGTPTTCNFDYSGALTEAVLLGNVAYRAGQKLQWDPVALKATNCPEADRLIRREYRKGWTL